MTQTAVPVRTTTAAARPAGSRRSATSPTPRRVDVTHGVILYLEDVTVSFDGFRALNALSLAIDDGELRCVIGPNGAGKTTMMDVITGKTRPDAGRVFYGQSIDLTRMKEPAIAQAGIGRKFQKPTVFEQHSVWDNLDLALKGDRRWFRALSRAHRPRGAAAHRGAPRHDRPRGATRRPAGLLAHGQKQRLEIGMLLAQDPRLLLLDEPVAGMTDEETERLAELLETLRGPALDRRRRARHGVRARASRAASPCCTRAACSPRARSTRSRRTRDVVDVYLGR